MAKQTKQQEERQVEMQQSKTFVVEYQPILDRNMTYSAVLEKMGDKISLFLKDGWHIIHMSESLVILGENIIYTATIIYDDPISAMVGLNYLPPNRELQAEADDIFDTKGTLDAFLKGFKAGASATSPQHQEAPVTATHAETKNDSQFPGHLTAREV